MTTTYTVKGKKTGSSWLFKYDLNGFFISMEIITGQLTEQQVEWLFSHRFPAHENVMKALWINNYSEHFEIIKAAPVLDFITLWDLYDYKVSKVDAEKAFSKLKPDEVIQCFAAVPRYLEYLQRTPGQAKTYLATYINKRRYEDELPIRSGKVYNPTLYNLAAKKTNK